MITNDVYEYKIKENIWIKLNPLGYIPSPRAAHAACALKNNHLAIFGGSCSEGELVPDDLYILQISTQNNNSFWFKVPNYGKGPGGRYGHSLIYYEPYLFIIGGNLGINLTNEVHFTIIDDYDFKKPIKWYILKTKENTPLPSPRVYHSTDICKYGKAHNMIILFGGRDRSENPLNDCWGLRKNGDNTWEWISASYEEGYKPKKRFQHTITFYYNFLIVLGGRKSSDYEQMPIEIFDTSTSKWIGIYNYNIFRHTAWIYENFIYIHGGFLLNKEGAEINNVMKKIDLSKIFNALNIKLESIMIEKPKESENNNPIELNIDLTKSIKNNDKKDPKEIITLYIKSSDQLLNCKVLCNINDRFNAIVNKVIEKEPSIIEKVGFFLCNGNKINEYMTIKDNKLKDGNILLLNIID